MTKKYFRNISKFDDKKIKNNDKKIYFDDKKCILMYFCITSNNF